MSEKVLQAIEETKKKYNFTVKKKEEQIDPASLPQDIEQIKNFKDITVGDQLKMTNDIAFEFNVKEDQITQDMRYVAMAANFLKFDGKKLSINEVKMLPLDFLLLVLTDLGA